MREVTSAEMLERLREVTDTVSDPHVSDAYLYKLLTAAVAKTWTRILRFGLGTRYVKAVTFTTAAGQQEYDLDTICTDEDFFQLKTLYAVEQGGIMRPINRVNPIEQYGLKPVNGDYAMKLYYVPCAPVFTTGSEVFDGINGWEEHSIQLAAAEVKKKKQDAHSPYLQAAKELEEEMKTSADRNQDSPPRVVRRARMARLASQTIPYSSQVTAWDIRGNNLELFYAAGLYGLYQ